MEKKEIALKLIKMYRDSYYSIGGIEVILNHIDQFSMEELKALYFMAESVFNKFYITKK